MDTQLQGLRCPQNWDFSGYPDREELFKQNKVDSDEDVESEETSDYSCHTGLFILNVILSYENYRKEKFQEALEYLDKIVSFDVFMNKYERSFKHVMLASKAHCFYKLDLINDSKKIIEELNSEKYSEAEEAAFKYIQSMCSIKYGDEGSKNCVQMMELVVKAVPDEPEFFFRLGNFIGRIRHYTFPAPCPTTREVEVLNKAVQLRRHSPKYSIALARTYIDMRYFLPKSSFKGYTELAVQLYRNLLQHSDSLSGNDIARCVRYLTKFKFDPDLEEYAQKALMKSNSTLVNHYVGLFYLRDNQNVEALKRLKIASMELPFLAGTVLLLTYRVNGDCLDDEHIDASIKEWLSHYEIIKHKSVFYGSISEFYLLVKRDLRKASLFFNHAYEHGIDKVHFITLTNRYKNIVYLAVLKKELSLSDINDEVISKAYRDIRLLPRTITNNNSNLRVVPSTQELINNLY